MWCTCARRKNGVVVLSVLLLVGCSGTPSPEYERLERKLQGCFSLLYKDCLDDVDMLLLAAAKEDWSTARLTGEAVSEVCQRSHICWEEMRVISMQRGGDYTIAEGHIRTAYYLGALATAMVAHAHGIRDRSCFLLRKAQENYRAAKPQKVVSSGEDYSKRAARQVNDIYALMARLEKDIALHCRGNL